MERRTVTLVDDVRVVSMADTWCDLADLGRRRISTDDLVVIGDACVAALDARSRAVIHPGARTSPGVRALHEALGGRVRPRGKVMLREALQLIRPRVRSPMESRSRLMFIRAGFPEPEVNGIITDEGGGWLAEGDLVWRAEQVIGEYQGEAHGGITRRSRDASRSRLLASRGWIVEELFAEDVFARPRRVDVLERMAGHLDLDPAALLIA